MSRDYSRRFLDTYPDTNRLLAHKMPKPHLIFHDGGWKLFNSWWKAAWTVNNPTSGANYIGGRSIADVRHHLSKRYDRRRFGGKD